MRKTACSSILKTTMYLNFKSDPFFCNYHATRRDNFSFMSIFFTIQVVPNNHIVFSQIPNMRVGILYTYQTRHIFPLSIVGNYVYVVNSCISGNLFLTGITHSKKEVMLSKKNFDLCPAIQNFRN